MIWLVRMHDGVADFRRATTRCYTHGAAMAPVGPAVVPPVGSLTGPQGLGWPEAGSARFQRSQVTASGARTVRLEIPLRPEEREARRFATFCAGHIVWSA